MSLSDLEKRAVRKPVEAELDRQKEKNAAVKKRLKGLQDAVKFHIALCDAFNEAAGIKTRAVRLQELADALKESKQV